MSVVTAIVMSLLGLFGNWVTHGGLIGLLGGVTATELRQQVVDEIKKLDIKPGPPGPPGTFAGRISFIAVRFGQNGSSEGVRGEGEPFVQLPQPGPQQVAPVTDFPICEVRNQG